VAGAVGASRFVQHLGETEALCSPSKRTGGFKMAEKEPIRYKAAVRNNDSGVASVSWGGGFPAQVQFSQGVSVDTGGFTGHA
jgi:hypothetical protein